MNITTIPASLSELTGVQLGGIDGLTSRNPSIDLRRLNSGDKRAIVAAGFGSIYFIGHEGDDGSQPIKVGWSRRAFDRLGSYKTHSWREPVVHEVLYVKSFMDVATERACKSAMRADRDDLVAAHLDEFREGSANIANVEKAVHNALTDAGKHHSKEWFCGPAAGLVSVAKVVLKEKFGVPYYTHNSMLRQLKAWKKEAGLA